MGYLDIKLSPSSRVAKNATVVGDVTLGEDSTVLFGAVLRADMGGAIKIGDRSNVQDLCCIHVPIGGDTVIGNNVTIGHGAILHGCKIDDGTLIGMGSIVLDGATIGSNSMIGAGSLVTGKAHIPDGMLAMGSPAKVVRELTDEELSHLATAADEYVEAGKELVEEGFALEGEFIL